MRNVTALIPSYCPDEKLISLVKQLQESGIACVVVNDGSSTQYDRVFENLPAGTELLNHRINKGKGASLKTGMKYIQETRADGIVVTADCDGQHTLKDILHCAEEAEENPGSLVLGVRSFHQEGVPLRSVLGNRISEMIFHTLSRVHVSDTQTGLRAFHVSLIPEFLQIEGDRYEYEMNQLMICAKKGIEIREVPIETVYEGNNECSHFNTVRDSVKIMGQMLKFSLSSLASFAIDTSLFAVLSSLFGFTGGTAAANVTARFCSASFNYEVNRRAVFRDHSSRTDSLKKYVILAAGILVCNTAVLYVLIKAGMGAVSAKILTEILFFLVSFSAQNRYVFRNERSLAA